MSTIDQNFTATDSTLDAIAIIGMALRVPGANTLTQFWSNLRNGVESTTFFTDQALLQAGVDPAVLQDPLLVKAFGQLAGADQFSADFFDLTPREAEVLDPQHRQLLECGWEALEHAGYGPGSNNFKAVDRIGLWAGIGLNSYLLHNLLGRQDLLETLGGWQIILGNDKDFAVSRVAYKLDLRGPVANISTACSTSLVAVVMGCQSLLSYQSDMILVGGCSIHLPQDQGYWYHPGGTLSPDGRCRAFDVHAQGTLDGNGVAMLVLKRLADAQAAGDTIHAVIRGFAVNNDGANKVGYTAPSVAGQAAVIREALAMAGVAADSIGYVETHGTGTDLGDLVEITALTEAFRDAGVTTRQQCAIGSLKTNVGHLDTAAGAASLIKTVLSLQHRQIPPSLHFTRANPKLALEQSPFYVNAPLTSAWSGQPGIPRRAGVSSFGIGGTNAHVIVEEAPTCVVSASPVRPWQVLPVSARGAPALQSNRERLTHYLMTTDAAIADIACTLQTGRRAFAYRVALLMENTQQAPIVIEQQAPPQLNSPPPVVFLLLGQDRQYSGMVQELARDEPLFQHAVAHCSEILLQHHHFDLAARLRGDAGITDVSDPLLLFVVEYALAQVWLALGVKPHALLGSGLGEYACACLAGVLSLEDALMLVVAGQELHLELLRKVHFQPPTIPYISCVTGDWIRNTDAMDPEYYLRLVCQPVQLDRALATGFRIPDAIFLELGAGQTMANYAAHATLLASQCDPHAPSDRPHAAHLALMTAVARLWTLGVTIDWSALFATQTPQRIPLPTYAFDHQRFWLDPIPRVTKEQASPVAVVEGKKNPDPTQWCYVPVWRELPPLAAVVLTGKWLVVGASSGLAPRLTAQLQAHGAEVVQVACPSAPTQMAQWEVWLTNTERDSQPFDYVIYLGVLDAGPLATEQTQLAQGFYALLALGQAFGRRVFTHTVTLIVIGKDLLALHANGPTPATAACLGPMLVLPQEYPNLRCRLLDIQLPPSDWQQTQLIAQLVAECPATERVVALRWGQRWVEGYASYPLPTASTTRLRAGGVYLITGGLGNIGLTLAQRIAQRAPGAHLILTTRGGTPVAGSERARRLQILDQLGAQVQIAHVDVTDIVAMTALIHDLDRDLGVIHGVIHAAGLVGKESFATVTESTMAFCTAQLLPKLNGARVLETVLGARPLDFCLLCSSLSSILGGLGFTAYSAANACLDSYAVQHNRTHPTHWTSVNWEGWQFDAQPTGHQIGAAVAELGLLPEEGAALFEQILTLPAMDRVVITTGNLEHRIRQWVEMPLTFAAAAETQSQLHKRPALLGPYEPPQNAVEREIAQLWERLLGIQGLGISDNFFALGGNSLLLTQLLAQIRKSFRLELALTALFERPTIRDIAALIEFTRSADDGREEGVI